ncbi:hypothetical protein STEG23_029585, partial [Scotinomys teguina]
MSMKVLNRMTYEKMETLLTYQDPTGVCACCATDRVGSVSVKISPKSNKIKPTTLYTDLKEEFHRRPVVSTVSIIIKECWYGSIAIFFRNVPLTSKSVPVSVGTRTQRSPRAGFAERQPDSSLSPVSNLTSDCERSMVTSLAIRALPLTSVACFVEICSSHCPVHQQHGLSPLHPSPARLLRPQLLWGTEPTAFQ